MPTKKHELDITKIILDVSKNIARISQTQMHFKDIFSALIEMAQKQNIDIQVINQKYKQIKEHLEDLEKPINETNKNVNIIMTQLDYKERVEFVKGKFNFNTIIVNLLNAIKVFFINSRYIAIILIIILIIIAWILGANEEKIGAWLMKYLPF